MLDEFEGKSAQSVAVQDHKLLDASAQRSVQKGEEAGSLPVDAGGNVFDELMIRAPLLERLDLADEIRFLFTAGHAGVAHFASAAGASFDDFAGSVEDLGKVVHVVQPLSIGPAKTQGSNSPVVRILAEGVVANAELSPDGSTGQESVVSIHSLQFIIMKNELFE